MKIGVTKKGSVELTEIYNELVLKTKSGDVIVYERDNGLEINTPKMGLFIKDGEIMRMVKPEQKISRAQMAYEKPMVVMPEEKIANYKDVEQPVTEPPMHTYKYAGTTFRGKIVKELPGNMYKMETEDNQIHTVFIDNIEGLDLDQ